MSWLVLSLVSASLLGLYDVSKKAAVANNAVLVVLLASSVAGWLFLSLLLGLAVWLPQLSALGFTLTPLAPHEHLLVACKASLVTLSWVLSFFALKHLPISFAVSVRATSPLFTVFGAIALFGETPTTQQWLGIAVVLVCYVALSLVGRREGIRFERNRWVLMLLGATLTGAVSGLYDKYLLQAVQLPPTTLQFWFAAYNVVLQALLVQVLWRSKRRLSDPFRPSWSVAAVGVLLILADQLYFHALAIPGALIAVVSLLRRGNVLISFPLGSYLFGDAYMKQKSVILLFLLAGVLLMLY